MRWMIPLVTAVWAVLKWSQERSMDRQREAERRAALYVMPFLSACEDLQSRLYNILEKDGLYFLRQRYPDGAYADEILYLIVRFFGWLATVMRYGPHTLDPETIRLTEALRSSFSTLKYPIGPFNFFKMEQKALGKIIMERFEGQYGVELDTIPFYEFQHMLKSPPLSESESMKQSLDALHAAKDAGRLAGRERLAHVQAFLVDLLNHQEARTGFILFSGQRLKCNFPRLSDVLDMPGIEEIEDGG